MEATMPTLPSKLGHNHLPWNKGRLLGQKRPLRPKDVWAIRSSKTESVILPCSVSRSTVNYEGAISSVCK
jgi:hypothetical protein